MDGESLAEVIRGAQRGDSAAYDRLVELYAGRIFGFLFRMTGSRHDAEDLMQEVFVRLVRTIGAYEHDNRFEAWLFRIASNLARDRLRKIVRAPRQVSPSGGSSSEEGGAAGALSWEAAAGTSEPSHARLDRREEIDAMNEALLRLPASEREVIMLRHFSQMSFKEIAEATGTPLGTALARAHRGLGHLREIMGASGLPGMSERGGAR